MEREIITEQVEIEVAGAATPMTAYVARPSGDGSHPPVLIGAELWGLTDEVRAIARETAALGYVAIAPHLYHRSDTDTETGSAAGLAETQENRERAFALVGQLTRDEVEADLRAALGYAREHAGASGAAGMLGFSLGGHIAYFAASRLELAAAAVYYPGWLPVAGTALSRPEPLLAATDEIARRDVRLLMFFAELDHVIDAAQRDEIGKALDNAGVRHEVITYPGAQHAFYFPGRPMHDAVAARDSWRRVRDLFAAELGT